ncbi:hypothetical protein PV325_003783 [Microctonus aethiopoides]|nr:hypothetical protein PV325_003783 [Microctonus aethiopoides]
MREEAETAGTPLEPGVPLEFNWKQTVESLRRTIEHQAAPEEEEVEAAQQPEEDTSLKNEILQLRQELRQLKRMHPYRQQQQQQPQWLGQRR